MRVARASSGAEAQLGDEGLVRQSASTLHRDGIHPNLIHHHFTGPSWVDIVVRAGLTFNVGLHGRSIRLRTGVASDTKPLHLRP